MEELVKKNQSLVNQKVEGKGKSVKINYAFILSVLIAVGGMFSTAKDLYKWQQSLFADKILSKKKREKLLTPNNQTSRGTHAYGWFISEIKSGANGYWTA